MAHPSTAVFERHLLIYRSLWRTTAFSFFLVPILYLVSIGMGVGEYVGRVGGFSYLDWIAPGLLATLAFQIGVSSSTYAVFVDFAWVGGLYVMRNTRVRINDMLAGWFLFVLVVLGLAVSVFLAVTAAIGAVHSIWTLLAPLVCALLAIACTALVAAFSATIRSDSYFPLLFRFAVVPTTLFSGVYFPVAAMPEYVQPLAYALPLWHGVELVRATMLGTTPAWPVAAHLGVLAAYLVVGYVLARQAFRKRLVD
ncbi:ABC transporter permease [Micromonospora sp. CPCC 205539]|uniref:ABC transporter permease n=1 Tax=Micromonospora sp. CPCC 205539 TaxID=3122408 RepID=UPI002FF3DA06